MSKTTLNILLHCSLFFLGVGVTYAWEVGLEEGRSASFMANPKYYTSSKYTAATLREGPVEVIQGGWVGESYGRFIGISGAYRSPENLFLDLSFGGVYLIDYSGDQLDGNKQFTFSIGIGQKVDNVSVMVKVRHFSNGNSQGSNWGQDFIIFNLSCNL